MANLCDVSIRIVGKEADVKTLVRMLTWEGEFEDSGISGIDEMHEYFYNYLASGLYSSEVAGFVKWSIKSSILEDLKQATKEKHLAIEAFGKESGFMFQERFVIAGGLIYADECVHWKEVYIPGCTTEELNALSEESGLTVDEIRDISEQTDDCFEVGGFVDEDGDSLFGVFCEQLEKYLRVSNEGEKKCIA